MAPLVCWMHGGVCGYVCGCVCAPGMFFTGNMEVRDGPRYFQTFFMLMHTVGALPGLSARPPHGGSPLPLAGTLGPWRKHPFCDL